MKADEVMIRTFSTFVFIALMGGSLLGGCLHSSGVKEQLLRIEVEQQRLREISGKAREALKATDAEFFSLKKEIRSIRLAAYLSDTISPVDFVRSGSLSNILEHDKVLEWADHEEILRYYLNRLEFLIASKNKNGVYNATRIIRLLELEPATWENYSSYIYKVYNHQVFSEPMKWQETSSHYLDIVSKMPNSDSKARTLLSGTISPLDAVRTRSLQHVLNGDNAVLRWADHGTILKFCLSHLEKLIRDRRTAAVRNVIRVLKNIATATLKPYRVRLENIYIRLANDREWVNTSDLFFDDIMDRISDAELNM
ncbi:MAG: hypothetical protein B6245_11805 [Desulfobacteraceae bacterium 4572_88]|nr:MAG: hypothetical protein B6245_11805 [Desulfobacteraceae bacterium 4572_88]